jgi:ribonuclease-3
LSERETDLARLSARLAELGVRPDGPFQQPELIARALTHSSFVAERGGESNERLEMLGDAVLGFVVTEMLFQVFPEAQEGALTRLRAAIVDQVALARKARVLDLGPLLALGRGEELSGGRDRDSALADTFEALIAALYLSEGLPVLHAMTERLFKEEALGKGAHAPQAGDYKTTLQERTQAAWKIAPSYRLASASGRDHERHFTVEVLIGDLVSGKGEGRTKKLAEQQAARAALDDWDQIVSRNAAGPESPAPEPPGAEHEQS